MLIRCLILILLTLAAGNFSSSPEAAEAGDFHCNDAEGKPVRVVEMKDTKFLSTAARDSSDQSRVVLQNNTILSWIKNETRLFFLAHECAHHALGHSIAPTYDMALEIEADCWASRKLVEDGLLDEEQVRLIQRDLYTFDVAEWRIAPGPFRQIDIAACVEAGKK